MEFPATNQDLRNIAQVAHNGDYYFDGRTLIHLQGTTMTVFNHNKSSWAQVMDIPASGVIYVNGVTQTNYSNAGQKFANDLGNVFVSGTLNGRLTIASANDIYITDRDPTQFAHGSATITGGLRYANTNFGPGGNVSADMLGLVAGNRVQVVHYGWPAASGGSMTSTATIGSNGLTIHAAIFALNHTFSFERHDINGPRGTLSIVGSIIQKYRGPVGTISGTTVTHGYIKDYHHDQRMTYETPPHFLPPTNSGWMNLEWRESHLHLSD